MGARVTYQSVEAMLEPTELAGLLGRQVDSVALAPMTTLGFSSTEADFRQVLVDGDPTPAAVLKIVQWSQDWVAIATEDTRGREVAIWECGVLDRLPPTMGHAVRGVARFADGAALLMDDLSPHFLPGGVPLTPERAHGVLRAMAAMHATFWEDPPTGDLGTAVCPLERRLTSTSATMMTSLGGVLPDLEVVAAFLDGWDRLPSVVDPGVARDLQALADDPAPVVTALDGYPTTLLHGDLRGQNVAWDGSRAIAIDWQPTVAPPAYDLAYFVFAAVPLHPDEAMATYREMLATELGPAGSWSWWDDQLDICVAAVTAMMANAWALGEEGYDPRRDLPWDSIHWWVARAERGLRLIGAA